MSAGRFTIPARPDDEIPIAQAQLKGLVPLLAMIPIRGLREHVNTCRRQIDRADSIGCLIDPTAYQNALYDGTLEDARIQLEIAEAILEARQLIQKRETQRRAVFARRGLCLECGLERGVHGHGETGREDSHPFEEPQPTKVHQK